MGDVYAAPAQFCPVHHGRMPFDLGRMIWICHGWDGEGCDYTVSSDEAGWTYVGTGDPVALLDRP
jgi:hypothetical protein